MLMLSALRSYNATLAAMEATADMPLLNLASSNLPYGADCGEYGRAGDIVQEYMDVGLTPRSHVDMYGNCDPFTPYSGYLPGCGPNICAPLVQISPDDTLHVASGDPGPLLPATSDPRMYSPPWAYTHAFRPTIQRIEVTDPRD